MAIRQSRQTSRQVVHRRRLGRAGREFEVRGGRERDRRGLRDHRRGERCRRRSGRVRRPRRLRPRPVARMAHRERGGYLRKIAAELERDSEANALVWTAETGVLHKYARNTAIALADTFRSYADLVGELPFRGKAARPRHGGELALVVREPVGVVGAIVPWNGAPGLTTNKVAPALLAGCSSRGEVLSRGARLGVSARGSLRAGRTSAGRPQCHHRRARGVGAARSTPGRGQDHLHGFHRGRPPHRLDLRGAHRTLHPGARRANRRPLFATITTSRPPHGRSPRGRSCKPARSAGRSRA